MRHFVIIPQKYENRGVKFQPVPPTKLYVDEVYLENRGFIDLNCTSFIPGSDTCLLFDIKYLATAQPVQSFLQQSHCQMTNWIHSLALPAQWTALNMPENLSIFMFKAYTLVGKSIEEFGKCGCTRG